MNRSVRHRDEKGEMAEVCATTCLLRRDRKRTMSRLVATKGHGRLPINLGWLRLRAVGCDGKPYSVCSNLTELCGKYPIQEMQDLVSDTGSCKFVNTNVLEIAHVWPDRT